VTAMNQLFQDLRLAVRQLRRNPGFAAVAVFTLALGIGANTAVFSVVKGVLLDSLPYRQADRLATLAAGDGGTLDAATVSFGEAEDWRSRSRSFESIALYRGWTPTATGGSAPEIVYGLRVGANFFPTLGVEPALGRPFLPEQDRPGGWHVVLLSHGYWQRRFAGDPKVIGTKVLLDQVPFEIVGVLPESFRSLAFNDAGGAPDVWAPLGYDASLMDACRTCRHLASLARIKEGITLEAARAEMKSIARSLAREFPKDYAHDAFVRVTPLRESWYGRARTGLWTLLGATALVLLIAAVNAASLFLVRARAKHPEVALRAALGAGRLRIVRQLLTESALVSMLGGAVGVVLAVLLTRLFKVWGPTEIPRLGEVQLDGSILLFAVVVSLGTGILTGLVPALAASRPDQREALQKGSPRSVGYSGRRARDLLVAIEVCLAFVLAAGSGLLWRSFLNAMSVEPGYEPRHLYTVNYALVGPKYADDAAAVRFEREALERIAALPEVQAVGIVSTLPNGGSFDQAGFHVRDRMIPDVEAPSVDRYQVSPGYFPAMGIPLKRGRLFTEADARGGARVALISEATAKEIWPGQDPLGKQIELGGRRDAGPWSTIVGVVGDVRQYGLDLPATPQAYELYTDSPFTRPCLVVRTALESQVLTRRITAELRALDKDVPVWNPAPMKEILSDSLARRRFTTSLFGGFGLLALSLAAVGIYGVLGYVVAQRTGEIGIRMALGARKGEVLKMVLRGGAKPVFWGLAGGLVGAVGLGRLLRGQLYGVGPDDPRIFAAVVLIVAGAAFLACVAPARKAANVDPMAALRWE
jgi:putative ABC transport system permease protein